MKKVLIIGGSGFIGKNLARYLTEKDYYVGVYDLSEEAIEYCSQYYCGDAYLDDNIFNILHEYDIVINALSLINPSNHIEKCLISYQKDTSFNLKLMSTIRDLKNKYFFISSGGAIYGNTASEIQSENSLCKPINFYGSVKLAIEEICHVNNYMINETRFISLRIANAFGPYQNYTKGVGFIDAAIKCALTGKTLKVYGDGSIVRDYIYITDICYIIEKIVSSDNLYEIYNISTGIGTSQNEIIKQIIEQGYDLNVQNIDSRLGDIKSSIIDNTLIRKEYNFKPLSISSAIRSYIEYLKPQYE